MTCPFDIQYDLATGGATRIAHPDDPHRMNWAEGAALTAQMYLLTGDEDYRAKAYRGMRNNLCLFRADGSASRAYVYPLFPNGQRGEFYEDFANEQDGALYFMIKYFKMLDRSPPPAKAASAA